MNYKTPKPSLDQIKLATCKITRLEPNGLDRVKGRPFKTPLRIRGKRVFIVVSRKLGYKWHEIAASLDYKYNPRLNRSKDPKAPYCINTYVDTSSVRTHYRWYTNLPVEEKVVIDGLCSAVTKELDLTLLSSRTAHPGKDLDLEWWKAS